MATTIQKAKPKKSISYAKWGYLFIAPFFVIFFIFTLLPMISTFYSSFFEDYLVGLDHIGPHFVGLANYQAILSSSDVFTYFVNTVVIWLLGFVPQIVVSLLLAALFTSVRLRLKGMTFFKTVIYMPNLIMAAAFAMLFFTIFSDGGPINNILMGLGMKEPFRFLSSVWGTRFLVGLMNFLMWFGNTTILLMAAMMGVDVSLFEAAEIDGASPGKTFFHITLPLIRPIMAYVVITSLIGGLQMFDVPQILTNGQGGPSRTSMTIVMYLNKHLYSQNYGLGGAVSVLLFVICAALSLLVYLSMSEQYHVKGRKQP